MSIFVNIKGLYGMRLLSLWFDEEKVYVFRFYLVGIVDLFIMLIFANMEDLYGIKLLLV